MKGCLLFLIVTAALLVTPVARAQSAPQMQAQADVDTVGVGDVVHLELTTQSGDGMPTDPQPGATPGFTVRGQSSSPSQTHISINGNRIDRFGLTVDWALQAQRVGTFSVGPPTVSVGGSRFAARPVTIHVVPAGQGPQRSQQQAQNPTPFPQGPGFSPFDPWRGLFPGADPGAQPTVTTDPKLALDAPGGSFYFLHAVVDNASAVVGQQVTFSVYEYLDESAGASIEVDPADVHDPTAAEFVKHPLLRDDQEAILVGYASVAGRVWKVDLVRRWALFPLRAGDLVIGPMSVTLVRPRSAAGTKRATDAIHIHVSEPPAAGRPPGYALGDVGHFSLTAQVTPRDLEQGGAVGVHVELSGTGNVPAAIAPPARTGVEWLAPELHEQLG
ncbi:MAG TPA: BatD family protein, partial [Polyangiaceae bacterium]